MTHRKIKKWFLMTIIGDGSEENPFRPLIGNTEHEGSYQAFYSEDGSVALVLFETDTEEKISQLKIKMGNIHFEKDESVIKKTKILLKQLDDFESKGFQELSIGEVENIGKSLDHKFDRIQIEEGSPSRQ